MKINVKYLLSYPNTQNDYNIFLFFYPETPRVSYPCIFSLVYPFPSSRDKDIAPDNKTSLQLLQAENQPCLPLRHLLRSHRGVALSNIESSGRNLSLIVSTKLFICSSNAGLGLGSLDNVSPMHYLFFGSCLPRFTLGL